MATIISILLLLFLTAVPATANEESLAELKLQISRLEQKVNLTENRFRNHAERQMRQVEELQVQLAELAQKTNLTNDCFRTQERQLFEDLQQQVAELEQKTNITDNRVRSQDDRISNQDRQLRSLEQKTNLTDDRVRSQDDRIRSQASQLSSQRQKTYCLGTCRSANCPLEAKSYSAYGPDSSCTPKYGYVKVNRVRVWSGSWCANQQTCRGVKIFLIDPFSCSVQDTHCYDTHHWAHHSTRLSLYLQHVNHGRIVLGLSLDEPTRQLNNALSTLKSLRVDVSDVQLRGSFAFIIQKGFPRKTMLNKSLTEAASNTNPAHLIVTVRGALVSDLTIT